MGKITVKHFLNTNLKPYIINKQNYFSIYIFITAKRKTTKVKSIMFDEYYSESDFDSIFNSDDENDLQMIKDEISTLTTITELIMEATGEFDTTFLASYFTFSNTISVFGANAEIFEYKEDKINTYRPINDQKKWNLNFGLDELFLEVGHNEKETFLYEFFSETKQTEALNFIKKENPNRNATEILKDINKMLFYSSIEYFKWYIEGKNKKNAPLKEKYFLLFENNKYLIANEIIKKYS
ncbi:hypothetical protein ACF3OB_05055 [Capnocytophaga canis]|uniref:hypothetical protein n=1 Tax=Capnocytophaga canis TaxID=1848903 RepID=UPI00370DA6AB